MANAGCINAIGFDGTYLRTLDTLDSANIGVGVQYCIPAPLDDKRLDYIKYTDKCGCTCCITGENEILVYATNGVIKNFTLTNDDTNEVVNVKWNDLFGSNRAYTMVRYKTGSHPTSISDGTLAVKETTQNQYSVSGYNVSGLTDGTTYYFTAFAVSQDGTIIVVQNSVITTDFFVPGYRKVAYIESNGNQYIDSLYKPNYNSQIYVKFAHNEHEIDTPIFGVRTSGGYNSFVLWSHPSNYSGGTGLSQCLFNGNNKTNISGYYEGTIIEFQYNKNSGYYGSTTWTWSNSSGGPGLNLIIFGLREGTSIDARKFSGKMRRFTIRESGTLKKDFIPCYRKSDNAVGMIDIVNNVFYTNLGSGSFTYGL